MRCKFKLDQITHVSSGGRSIKMSPVYGDTPENKAFFASTPSGDITLYTVNAKLVDEMTLGGEYYIDITKAS